MELSKKWTKSFLNKWRKHYTNPDNISQPANPHNIHKMETRRNLRQETIRPQLFFKVLSKEIINPFHLSRLRTNHHKQIQSIKTPSNQQMYEQQTTLKINLLINNALLIRMFSLFIVHSRLFDTVVLLMP